MGQNYLYTVTKRISLVYELANYLDARYAVTLQILLDFGAFRYVYLF